MPVFRYTAITPSGETRRGSLEAGSADEVIRRIQRDGNMPVRAERASESFVARLLGREIGNGGALRRQEVADITRELAIMLSAGQDLDRALRFLVETASNSRVAAVMGQLRDTVRDGGTFAGALAKHPRSFPRLYVGLVQAGETGGALGATLERMADMLERQRALAAMITSAMIYPALLLVAAIGSIALLLTQVLPQFVPMFEENGVPLPTPTRLMIAAGDFLSNYGLYLLLLGLLAGLGARALFAQPGPRMMADRLILRLPVVGPLTKEVLAARFGRTLGTLLLNGVPLIAALGIVRDVIGNLAA